jgi:hypothetical protein
MRRALLCLLLTSFFCTSFKAAAVCGEAAGLRHPDLVAEPAGKKRKKKNQPHARPKKGKSGKKKARKKRGFMSRSVNVKLSINLFGSDDDDDCDHDDALLTLWEEERDAPPRRERGRYPGILKSGRVGK